MFGTGLFAPIYRRLVRARTPRIALEDYLGNMPNLHTWDKGKTWNTGGFSRDLLEPIHKLIGDRKLSFIETGAGNSTIFFLQHDPVQVVSIAPNEALFTRIRYYCAHHGISDAPLNACVEGSQWALPRIAQAGHCFDFALIDGDHNWPMVFVDYHYINYLVRPGGHIMLDDTQLYSVSELVALLKEQRGYETVLDLGKSIVFRKNTEAREMPGFGSQPYIMRRSGLALAA